MKQKLCALLLAGALTVTLCACPASEAEDIPSGPSSAPAPLGWDPDEREEREEERSSSVDSDMTGSGIRSAEARKSEVRALDPDSPSGVAARFTDALIDWELDEASQYLDEYDAMELAMIDVYMSAMDPEEIAELELYTALMALADFTVWGETVEADEARVDLLITAVSTSVLFYGAEDEVARRLSAEGVPATQITQGMVIRHLNDILKDRLEGDAALYTITTIAPIYLNYEGGRWIVDFYDVDDLMESLIGYAEDVSYEIYSSLRVYESGTSRPYFY